MAELDTEIAALFARESLPPRSDALVEAVRHDVGRLRMRRVWALSAAGLAIGLGAGAAAAAAAPLLTGRIDGSAWADATVSWAFAAVTTLAIVAARAWKAA